MRRPKQSTSTCMTCCTFVAMAVLVVVQYSIVILAPQRKLAIVRKKVFMPDDICDFKANYMKLEGPVGRLGNQLFQYAMIVSTAHKYNFTIVLPSTFDLMMKYFELEVKWDTNVSCPNTFIEQNWGVYSNAIEALNTNHNWTFRGYFQSYRYHNKRVVREKIKFRDEIIKPAIAFMTKVKSSASSVVCIHVRRGDFLERRSEGYTLAPIEYIVKAQNFLNTTFHEHFKFVVLSDDIQWCRDNIKGDDVVFSNFSEPGMDLALSTQCDHVIITSGTFSWWAGWLSGGTVVYYKAFPRPGSVLASGVNLQEYYPAQWIGIE